MPSLPWSYAELLCSSGFTNSPRFSRFDRSGYHFHRGEHRLGRWGPTPPTGSRGRGYRGWEAQLRFHRPPKRTAMLGKPVSSAINLDAGGPHRREMGICPAHSSQGLLMSTCLGLSAPRMPRIHHADGKGSQNGSVQASVSSFGHQPLGPRGPFTACAARGHGRKSLRPNYQARGWQSA